MAPATESNDVENEKPRASSPRTSPIPNPMSDACRSPSRDNVPPQYNRGTANLLSNLQPGMSAPYSPYSRYPAAPPASPYTPPPPFLSRPLHEDGGKANAALPSFPPQPKFAASPSSSAHYKSLLQSTLQSTLDAEQARVAQWTQHEANYTSLEEFKHALARERRHSTHLALELAKWKLDAKYSSFAIHSQAEIGEEARVNSLMKQFSLFQKDMVAEKGRLIVELEREEERIINRLTARLEEVRREKLILERQMQLERWGGSVTSSTTLEPPSHTSINNPNNVTSATAINNPNNATSMPRDRLHAKYEQMMADIQPNPPTDPINQSQTTEEKTEDNTTTKDETIDEQFNEEEEESEEEEEDILEDNQHDPEMEEELKKLLEQKGKQ